MSKRHLVIYLCIVLPGWLQAQECNSNINATTPLHRFSVHDDGTVTDSRSGLRWQRCAVGYSLDDGDTPSMVMDDKCVASDTAMFNWQGALQSADDLNTSGGSAGFSDWRVPGLKELVSIVEYKCYYPVVNSALFPDTEPAVFWSSTTTNQIGTALVLDFKTGINSVSYLDVEGFEHYVRLVRGGG